MLFRSLRDAQTIGFLALASDSQKRFFAEMGTDFLSKIGELLAYKLSIWTLSAVMCGVAGALYVPQVGIINPSEMSPSAGIEIAIWAAVGGRATLIGPIIGAFFVNGAKSWFTVAFPEFWLYFLGGLFIAVTLFLPQGIVGLFKRFARSTADATHRIPT